MFYVLVNLTTIKVEIRREYSVLNKYQVYQKYAYNSQLMHDDVHPLQETAQYGVLNNLRERKLWVLTGGLCTLQQSKPKAESSWVANLLYRQ